MAYPDKYTRQYDFVAYQNANPTRPLPADKVNADYNLVEISTGEIVDFLKIALRSDGFLANESVGRDQLTTDVITLLDATLGNVTALATAVAAIISLPATSVSFSPAGNIAATNVQDAIQELDAEKGALASPTFTGVPAAPTAAPGTNTTQISTTAFVKAAIDVVLGGVSASFDTLSEIVAGMQPLDATLTALAAIATSANKLIYATGSDTFSTTDLSAFARTFLDDADAATVLATIGAQPLDATLTALAAFNTNGILCQTAADTFAGRTLTAPAAGITVSNGGGVAGNPTLALANDLSAVEALAANGIAVRTATDTWTVRTIGAGTGIAVTNGDGVSGAPSIALAAAQASTVSALTDGATPALDASLGNIFTLAAAGDRTIAVPTNATNGQKIVIRHLASGGARTLALNTGANGFRFGSDITALTQTASGKTDYIGAIWSTIDSKWDVVAYAKGY